MDEFEQPSRVVMVIGSIFFGGYGSTTVHTMIRSRSHFGDRLRVQVATSGKKMKDLSLVGAECHMSGSSDTRIS